MKLWGETAPVSNRARHCDVKPIFTCEISCELNPGRLPGDANVMK